MEEKRAKRPQVDLNNIQNMSPDDLMATTKSGKPLMVFVQIAHHYSEKESDSISERYQQNLQNGGLAAQRFSVGKNRFIFMFQDGADAFKAKPFLTDQPECLSVDIENQKFPGRASPDFGKDHPKTEL